MLNITAATDAIVAALAGIPELAAAMTVQIAGTPVVRIDAYHFRQGTEVPLIEAVYQMPSPSMLVAWQGTKGGNFNGYTIWKHTWSIYYRMGNAAGQGSPIGYEDLWRLTVNGVPSGSPVNIRYMELYPGLDIMDTPSVGHAIDPQQIDFFEGTFVIPEIGDN